MSDTATIPFQTSNGLDPAAPTPDEPGGSSRRTVYLLAGAGAAALLSVGGYVLLFSGGDEPAPAAPNPPAASVQPVPPAAPAEPAAPATAPKLTARNFGTDPFAPLVQEATESIGGTTTGGTTTGTSTDTSTGSTGSTGATGSTGGSTVTEPTPTARHAFRVVSVAPDNSSITVKVDGKTYSDVRAGEVFATYFKVVLISGPSNAFQYGEEKFSVVGTKKLTIA